MATFGGPADWWTDGTDAGRKHIATKGIVQNGLVLNLDAGVSDSYPGSGTTWTDLSGNGNNGTLTNMSATPLDSANGGSLVFDGVNDYVDLGDTYTNGYVEISVSSWVFIPSTFSTRIEIVTKYLYPNGWLVYFSTDNKFSVDGRENDSQYFQNKTSDTFLKNRWYNCTFTKNLTNWKLYINSTLKVSNNNGNGTTSFNNNGVLAVASIPLINNSYGKCSVSQVSIYNRALTQQEILQNYNATRGRFGI